MIQTSAFVVDTQTVRITSIFYSCLWWCVSTLLSSQPRLVSTFRNKPAFASSSLIPFFSSEFVFLPHNLLTGSEVSTDKYKLHLF